MCEYKNGKIYKIVCEITGEVYIGSTRLSLEDRLKKHLNQNCCSRQIIDRNKYDMKLLELYPCNSKQELCRREGEYQLAFECINTKIAGRTPKEHYQDNIERMLKKSFEYYHNNKEEIAKKASEYYQNNKEKISEYDKQRYQDNKEHFKEYSKQYRLDNSLEVAKNDKLRKSKEVICECGLKLKRCVLARHKRSKRHIDLMSKLMQPCADPGDGGTLACYRVGRI